jgi:NAD-dependent dihydropyrimidine dehydrogenase PreA subunit
MGQHAMVNPPNNPHANVHNVQHALAERRFFKLIAGGSLTDAQTVGKLAWIYAMAGAQCVDIAPDLAVINAVVNAWDRLPPEVPHPLLMVSIPLDADPHFRKIEVDHDTCILCDACLPVCPTQAISVANNPQAANPNEINQLAINQPLCYGCNRCVAVCPTSALQLHPFRGDDDLAMVLAHPAVGAVEIHTRWCDAAMLQDVYQTHHAGLKDKLIAICFAPQHVPSAVWTEFMPKAQALTAQYLAGQPLVWQIDGQPMSGSTQAQATLPALNAARLVANTIDLQGAYLTISGGINPTTAQYLALADYADIHGAGMGTVARQLVWEACQQPLGHDDPFAHDVHQQAVVRAKQVVAPFQNRYDSDSSTVEPMSASFALAAGLA